MLTKVDHAGDWIRLTPADGERQVFIPIMSAVGEDIAMPLTPPLVGEARIVDYPIRPTLDGDDRGHHKHCLNRSIVRSVVCHVLRRYFIRIDLLDAMNRSTVFAASVFCYAFYREITEILFLSYC